tara:strand:- start:64 stop:459 length:396 start_codon:yes stop_codon:yes gene_type:complete
MKFIVKLALAFFLFTSIVSAAEFGLEFEWGNLKKCNTGNPNKVDNPLFKLSNVPEGTKILQFRMKDKNAPGYNHGGGKVEYSGQNTIEPGAFKYKSPCPPGGVHTYVWTVTAKNEKKKKIGKAKAQRKYPE